MSYDNNYNELNKISDATKSEWDAVRKDLKKHSDKIMEACKNPVEVSKKNKIYEN